MQLKSVPLVVHFPPTEGPYAKKLSGNQQYEVYDLQRKGVAAEDIARYIEQITGTRVSSDENQSFPCENERSLSPLLFFQITITRPTDWSKIITFGIVGLVLFALGIIAYRNFAFIFSNRMLWAFISVAWIATMTSGFMWNQIRQPPFTGVRDGKPEVFAPGFSNQFVLETQIMSVMCWCCLFEGDPIQPAWSRRFTFLLLCVFRRRNIHLFRFAGGLHTRNQKHADKIPRAICCLGTFPCCFLVHLASF